MARKYEGGQIGQIIPNRYPLMILDWIEIKEDQSVLGEVKLTKDDWFFACHYPGNPIFPGCLLIETMTQVFSATFLAGLEKPEIPILSKIGETTIKSGATIGDTIRFEAHLTSSRRGVMRGVCTAYKLGEENEEMATIEITEILPSQMVRIG